MPIPPLAESTGFSRTGIFFFVLGIILIFGTGGIGLYFKFIYLPNLNRTKLPKVPISTNDLPDAGTANPIPIPPTPTPTPDAGSSSIGTNPPTPPTPTTNPPVSPTPTPSPVRPPRPRPPRPRPPRPRPPRPRPQRVAVSPPVSRSPCPRGMAHIRAGGFRMGSAVDDRMRSFGEKSLQWVKTGAYCIDRFEYPGPGRQPKASISFYSAQTACEKQGKRLCSEEEWERACKGSRNIRYPYGDTFDAERCNTRTAQDTNRSVTASGRFRKCRSPYGIFDMSGNVSEWTSSYFRAGRPWRVVRGGSAKRPDWSVRCASRTSRPPGSSKPTLGFRCCANPK